MTPAARARERTWAGYLLGFALGGFFDGILLHQVLQWHHLLSGVGNDALRDLRTQILADGLFHLLMYIIALCGLWALWRARTLAGFPGRFLVADALIGFGVWHALDAVLSHWVLGIHRIKMDSTHPLMWDVLWLIVFGIVPLVWGVMMRKRETGGPRHPAIAAVLAGAVLLAGPIAALAPTGSQQFAVVVPPSQASRLLDGLQQIGGAITWADRSGALWIIHLRAGARPEQLHEHGALFVTSSPAALGCLAWTRTRSK